MGVNGFVCCHHASGVIDRREISPRRVVGEGRLRVATRIDAAESRGGNVEAWSKVYPSPDRLDVTYFGRLRLRRCCCFLTFIFLLGNQWAKEGSYFNRPKVPQRIKTNGYPFQSPASGKLAIGVDGTYNSANFSRKRDDAWWISAGVIRGCNPTYTCGDRVPPLAALYVRVPIK